MDETELDGIDEFGADKEGVNRKSAKERRGKCAYVCVEGESGLVKKSKSGQRCCHRGLWRLCLHE